MSKVVHILGKSQREQWHTVVNVIRHAGREMTQEGLNGLCDELDRYIDFAEDIFEDINREQGDL